MSTLTQAIDLTNKRIIDTALRYGREPSGIQLIAVSKTRPAEEIRAAYEYGLTHFGESYLQEALDKIQALHGTAIVWHFIGPMQSNKTRPIAAHFDWAHSVDRIKIARRLSEQRPPELAPLKICLQVNISNEASKSGAQLEQLAEMAAEITTLPRLRLRGLMAIPAPTNKQDKQLQMFNAVADVQQQLIKQGLSLDTLSMGMSDDLEMAIKAGATHVRVGAAIFGARGS